MANTKDNTKEKVEEVLSKIYGGKKVKEITGKIEMFDMNIISPVAINNTNIRYFEKQDDDCTEFKTYTDDIKAIRESINKDGQKYPIKIRALTEAEKAGLSDAEKEIVKYGIIDGHTRYAAMQLLKKDKISAQVITYVDNNTNEEIPATDIKNYELMQATKYNVNAQLTSKQWGAILCRLYNKHEGITYTYLAKIYGKSKSWATKSVNAYLADSNKKMDVSEEISIIKQPAYNKTAADKAIKNLNDYLETDFKNMPINDKAEITKLYDMYAELTKKLTAAKAELAKNDKVKKHITDNRKANAKKAAEARKGNN